jgi:hypothetical protein
MQKPEILLVRNTADKCKADIYIDTWGISYFIL